MTRREIDRKETRTYEAILERRIAEWQAKMTAMDYGQITKTTAALYRKHHIKILEGPRTISIFGLETGLWISRYVVRTYEQRMESAHAKAAWYAILQNPEYLESFEAILHDKRAIIPP